MNQKAKMLGGLLLSGILLFACLFAIVLDIGTIFDIARKTSDRLWCGLSFIILSYCSFHYGKLIHKYYQKLKVLYLQ